MTRATPRIRSFAERLTLSETPSDGSSEPEAPAAFHAIDRLRPHLAALMGNGGFRALLSRALALAKAEASWLGAVRVTADGALDGLDSLHAQRDVAEILEGKVVLLAQLLGLLVAFVGPSLTARLVGEIWPQLSLSERDFDQEVKRETAR